MKKFVYSFNEGSKDMNALLGGKGANLAEMTRIGLPVPFGFTITTEACTQYYEEGNTVTDEISDQITEKLADLEYVTEKKFGEAQNPLLLSVRAGSAFSMPGMLDTFLDLGLNDETVKGLAEVSGNARFAYNSYARFIAHFGVAFYGVPREAFEEAFELKKKEFSYECETEFCAEALESLVEDYKKILIDEAGAEFPQDVNIQLMNAITSIFDSWNSETNALYREVNRIPDDAGVAVNVQAMVFGNTGDESGTGVAYTRNPNTGENVITGEILFNAQGDDVFTGGRPSEDFAVLEKRNPGAYKQFVKIAKILEKHYTDMQFVEFTIENGRLYILQTRDATRTSAAALKIAVALVNEGTIDRKTALMRVKPSQIEMLMAQANDSAMIDGLFSNEDYITLMKWADDSRSLRIRATVNNLYEARKAFEYGAEGIGLFRTEYMTIDSLEADDVFEFQKMYFRELFEITKDSPVGIRLFNHVFSEHISMEANELIQIQATAIVAAAYELRREKNLDIYPGIIVPLVGIDNEYITVRNIVENAISKYMSGIEDSVAYAVGHMVDVPRVALTVEEIASDAEFFSFELDNLTHRTFGFSMDEPVSFITKYRESIALESDMFTGFDNKAVGKLIKNAADSGKSIRGNIKLGICKEIGVDTDVIDFCTQYGFTYITCAPEYIPASKLTATQSKIKMS